MDWYAPTTRTPNNPEGFSYGDRECILWVLRNAQTFDLGQWPQEPRDGYVGGDTRRVRHNGSFCVPKETIGEIRYRLNKCGDPDALLVELRWCFEYDLTKLSRIFRKDELWCDRRSVRALNYITKNDFRKRPPYKEWCRHTWVRIGK